MLVINLTKICILLKSCRIVDFYYLILYCPREKDINLKPLFFEGNHSMVQIDYNFDIYENEWAVRNLHVTHGLAVSRLINPLIAITILMPCDSIWFTEHGTMRGLMRGLV